MTQVILLRHFKTDVDPDTPVEEWTLTADGEQQMQQLLKQEWLEEVDAVFSSPEPKALRTARAVADSQDIPITTLDELAEVDRSGEGFIEDHDQYVKMVEEYLTHPTVPFNWEDREQVEDRIHTVLQAFPAEGTVLAVTHGMFLATLLPSYLDQNPVTFWKDLEFGATFEAPLTALEKAFNR